MSFLATLFIDDRAITVLECSFEIHKKADETGKPISLAYGGQVEISFEMNEKDDEFFTWAKETTMLKDGNIVFYKDDVMAVKYKLEFKQGYCLSFSAQFSSEDRFMGHIVISALELKFGKETHVNHWGILQKTKDN